MERMLWSNLDGRKVKETHLVWLFIDRNTKAYFDSFIIKYIPQEILSKIKDKPITHNIFKIKSNDSIICGLICIAFIEYMLSGKKFDRLYQFIFSKWLYKEWQNKT